MLRRRLSIAKPSIGKGGMIVLCLLLVALTLALAACSGSTSASVPSRTQAPAKTVAPAQTPAPTTTKISLKPSGPVDAKWIEPLVNGDTVSISVSEIENNWNTRFKLQTTDGNIVTMAYILNGAIYVRASVCPPCRSQGFTLSGNTLVCDICGTRFAASTGDGISGACVKFPKASVSYTISDGNMVMSIADLVTAYQKTLKG